jgi:2-keto-4-pentenoate hydratase/2-oxohepta-3-ene-1,7-dioic acid hydratase in catechol pathway
MSQASPLNPMNPLNPLNIVRLFRVEHEGAPRYATEVGTSLRLVEGDIFAGPPYKTGGEITPARLLAPVTPSKIVCVGLNYKDHAAEMKKPLPPEPLLFMKPSTAVIGQEDAIRLPPGAGRVDHEAELGIVIRKRAYRVPAEQADGYVLGYTCVNDVTARELQVKDVQYTRAKGFDTFAPIGPCVAIGLEAGDLDIEGWVNGEKRQSSNTRQLIFPVRDIVAYVSSVMTLLPGDVIATGTPAGVGPLKEGDRVTVKIAGIGELVNPVI